MNFCQKQRKHLYKFSCHSRDRRFPRRFRTPASNVKKVVTKKSEYLNKEQGSAGSMIESMLNIKGIS
jgi:hypothetical protein